MKIEAIEISGFISAFKALRLPFGLTPRSQTRSNIYNHNNVISQESFITIDDKDMELVQRLIKSGDEHAKAVRGIQVYATITAPVYWWCEMETYTVGHTRLASSSTMHIDCKGLHGEALQRIKSEIPMGKELTKIDCFSYQTLRRIVCQRHNHRLPEWHIFIDWVKTLPLAKELIFINTPLD